MAHLGGHIPRCVIDATTSRVALTSSPSPSPTAGPRRNIDRYRNNCAGRRPRLALNPPAAWGTIAAFTSRSLSSQYRAHHTVGIRAREISRQIRNDHDAQIIHDNPDLSRLYTPEFSEAGNRFAIVDEPPHHGVGRIDISADHRPLLLIPVTIMPLEAPGDSKLVNLPCECTNPCKLRLESNQLPATSPASLIATLRTLMEPGGRNSFNCPLAHTKAAPSNLPWIVTLFCPTSSPALLSPMSVTA